MAAIASTNGRDTDCNKLVFYQIQERAAPVTILDQSPTMRPDADDEGQEESAANQENQEGALHEMSASVKHVLDCGEATADANPVHSIVWEDVEPMEGQAHSQLVTGDRSRIQIWDLEQMQVGS